MSKPSEPLLHEIVRKSIEKYLGDLQGEKPSNLAQFVTSDISLIDINLIENLSLIETY